MRRVLLLLALAVLIGSPLYAQTYDLRVYAVGASAPQQTFTFPAVSCGQDPAPLSASNVNPTTAEWIDVLNAGKVCKFVDSGTGPLKSRPLGAYEATLTVTTDAGTSDESARAAFFLKPLPTVPSGLRLFR